jgi:hypothetical protein
LANVLQRARRVLAGGLRLLVGPVGVAHAMRLGRCKAACFGLLQLLACLLQVVLHR